MSVFFLRMFDSQQFLFLCQLQTTAIGHREGLQDTARGCKGPVGLLRVTEGCGRLWGTIKGPPMVPRVTDFTDFCDILHCLGGLGVLRWS
jgi:hypothetical protein